MHKEALAFSALHTLKSSDALVDGALSLSSIFFGKWIWRFNRCYEKTKRLFKFLQPPLSWQHSQWERKGKVPFFERKGKKKTHPLEVRLRPQSTIIYIEKYQSLVHGGVANRDITLASLVHGTERWISQILV